MIQDCLSGWKSCEVSIGQITVLKNAAEYRFILSTMFSIFSLPGNYNIEYHFLSSRRTVHKLSALGARARPLRSAKLFAQTFNNLHSIIVVCFSKFLPLLQILWEWTCRGWRCWGCWSRCWGRTRRGCWTRSWRRRQLWQLEWQLSDCLPDVGELGLGCDVDGHVLAQPVILLLLHKLILTFGFEHQRLTFRRTPFMEYPQGSKR